MHPLIEDVERKGLSRRRFLRNFFLTAGGVASARYLTACGGSSSSIGLQGAANPFFESAFATMGPLLPADDNGVQLPAGFTSRVVAKYNLNVIADDGSDTGYAWHTDPDGGATFSTDDGGWIYVSNSERRDNTSGPAIAGTGYAPPNRRQDVAAAGQMSGGVSALRFNAKGELVDAYRCQANTTTNCSGGATPWGTWINGEEILDGMMFECSPLRDGGDAVHLPAFGIKGHEMVAVDEAGRAIYHTEDAGGDDRFYRTIWSVADWPSGERPIMNSGVLQVLGVPAGLIAAREGPTPIEWHNALAVDQPQFQNRHPDSTLMKGNEGVWHLNGFIFLTTKSDDTIWAIDTTANTIESIYDPTDGPIGSPVDANEPPLAGVDNITMTLDGEMLVVEDGGDMRCMVLMPDQTTIPLLRLPGDPGATEVTGVAIAPDGRRVYVSGQRTFTSGDGAIGYNIAGLTYEITLPFSVQVDRPLARPMPNL
jgi:hypothetical protein